MALPMSEHSKFLLADSQIPTAWVNVLPALPEPLDPPLNPKTRAPLTPQDLLPIFPMELIEQEFSPKPEIDIPGEIMDIYRLWRATPLYRARRLEKALDTPAHIYYKYEGTSPAGSHKPNTAVAQAYYNKRAGIRRLATETGAGQWGSALSLACRFFGLECTVYMVRISYDQKPYRRMMMHVWGGEVFASPSDQTNSGRAVLAATPDSPGSLGIAISEAVEDAATHADTNYALGSVLNHVMLHQTVIGQEAKLQMQQAGEEPEVVIGCFGGGSNFGGLALPYVLDRLAGRQADPADQDVHPGPRFRAARHSRRRLTLSRSFAPAQPPPRPGTYRGQGLFANSGLRRRLGIRPHRRHSAGAGIVARHPRSRGRSPRGKGRRTLQGDPFLPERPRPLRSRLLRDIPQRQIAGLRVPGSRDRDVSGGNIRKAL
jgi:cysteine synthase